MLHDYCCISNAAHLCHWILCPTLSCSKRRRKTIMMGCPVAHKCTTREMMQSAGCYTSAPQYFWMSRQWKHKCNSCHSPTEPLVHFPVLTKIHKGTSIRSVWRYSTSLVAKYHQNSLIPACCSWHVSKCHCHSLTWTLGRLWLVAWVSL